jgi:hypothetical protein
MKFSTAEIISPLTTWLILLIISGCDWVIILTMNLGMAPLMSALKHQTVLYELTRSNNKANENP